MKKRILLIGLLLAVLLCACAEKPAPTAPPDTPTQRPSMTEPQTLPEETEPPATAEPTDAPPVQKSTTVLWIDGVRYPACYELDGEKYVSRNDLLAQAASDGLLFGHTLDVSDDAVWIDGAETGVTGLSWNGDVFLPTAELLPLLGFTELKDESWNQRFYTRIPKSAAIPTGYGVPILMYHAVSDNVWGIAELFVSPANMEAQIKAMLDAGCTPITFEDLDRIDEIQKPVILTFDDGYRDNYTELFPLLKQYGVKVTIFLISDCTGNDKNLTEEQIREMQASGLVSFQSHTKTHSRLDELSEDQLETEMSVSMMAIARLTGKQPFVLCYPEGRANALAKQVAAKYYEFGLYMGGTKYVTGGAPFDVYRQYISRETSLSKFLSYVN